jgi:hypothetical protein
VRFWFPRRLAGLHQCFGVAINGVQITEPMAALLRLPNLVEFDA